MMSKKIKMLLLERDMNMQDLADKIGVAQSNLSRKFKRDNFTIEDLSQIANVLDCKLEIDFIPNSKRED